MASTTRISSVLLQFQLAMLLLVGSLLHTTAAADTVADVTNKTASSTMSSLFDSAQGIKLGGSILAVVAIGGGAVICVAGYKLFRPTLFAIGFALGGTVAAIVADKIFASETYALTASWVAFLVGGVLVGCIVVSIYVASIFIAGAAAGVVLAVMVNTSVGYLVYPSDPSTALLILCVVLGLVGGILALKLEKPVLIVSTSLAGAGMLVWGVGYFGGEFPSADDLKRFGTQNANGDWTYDLPTAWWAYLAGILVLFVLGMLVQFRKTGLSGDYHKSNA